MMIFVVYYVLREFPTVLNDVLLPGSASLKRIREAKMMRIRSDPVHITGMVSSVSDVSRV